jgi:hypothetical protein
MALAGAVDHDALRLADSASLEPQLTDEPQRVTEFVANSVDIGAILSFIAAGPQFRSDGLAPNS